MEYTYLGSTGLQVSRLCLGTMNFGPVTDEKEAFAIMDEALDEGINFFDTADVYGRPHGGGPAGWTEEIIGRWFAQGGNRRERVVLGTKVFGKMDDPADGPNDNFGLSAYKIRRHIDASLRRLQTDHIELYQMHHVDRHVSWDEIFGVYESLISAGKVVYAGSANFGARHLAYAHAAADRRNFLGLVSEQHRYSLRCRLPELEVLPACRELGMGVIAWSPLDNGLLGGHALDGKGGPRSAESVASLRENERDSLTGFVKICREIGEPPANVALAWTMSNPVVTCPIIGPRTVEQLNQSLESVKLTLSPELLDRLDHLFPGPGGASPEAYAW